MMINGTDTLLRVGETIGSGGDCGKLENPCPLKNNDYSSDPDNCCQIRIWLRAPGTPNMFKTKPEILIFEDSWILRNKATSKKPNRK